MPSSVEFQSRSVAQTQALAAKLTLIVRANDCLTLAGNLGVGKTCFSKGLIHGFSGESIDSITSPTFTLCQEYISSSDNSKYLYHYDLYRLEDESELEQFGFEETIEQGITLIEWPEIARDYLPKSRLEIYIQNDKHSPDARIIRFTAHGDWQKRLTALSLSYD